MEDETFNIEDLLEDTSPKANIGLEREICINSILNTDYIKGVKPLLNDLTLLESPVSKTVMSWAIAHFANYGKCLYTDVMGVYESKKAKMSETQSKDIADFLESLSNEVENGYQLHNLPFALDQAEQYIGLRSIQKVHEQLGKQLLTNNLPKARQLINNFNITKQVGVKAIDGFADYSRFEKKKEKSQVLFKMPYPFNEIYGDICSRHLSAVSAQSKVGKTREMAWFTAQSIRNGKNVFVASLEMSNEEFLNLVDLELLRMDIYGGEGFIPYFKGDKLTYTINYKKLVRDNYTPEELKRKYQLLIRYCGYGRIFTANWPQKVCRIEDDLIPELDRIKTEEHENIEVLVVDYADLLRENVGDERADNRIKIGNQWKALKRLAEERHLHCHTASQLNRENLLAESASKEQDANFIIRLEQKGDEKDMGIYRQYVAFHRAIPYNPYKALLSLSNNGIGLFNLDARWSTDDNELPEIDDNFRLWKSYDNDYNYYDEDDIYNYI